MKIPKDIRSKINQLDEISREIVEYLHDNDEEHTEETIALQDNLEELEGLITTLQEAQGWLG